MSGKSISCDWRGQIEACSIEKGQEMFLGTGDVLALIIALSGSISMMTFLFIRVVKLQRHIQDMESGIQ